MRTFTDFQPNDDGTVTAYPRSQNDEPVRFEASIAERNEDKEEEGNWEELISDLMDYELGEALDINDDGEAVIGRQEAQSALVEADDEFASTGYQAEAVIDYLHEQDIIETEDDRVTVLKDFKNIKESGYTRMYNNWAAMFDTCIERIDVARDRVEQAKNRFEQRERETEAATTDVDSAQRMDEIRQEIDRIVGNRSPNELSDQERQRVQNLRKQYHFHESMEEAEGVDVTEVADNAEELGFVMERFERMRAEMKKRREEFRELALGEAIFPEDLVDLSEQYSSFLSAMSDTMAPADRMKEESLGGFLDDIGVGGDQIDELSEQAEQIEGPDLAQSQTN
ncbi:MAG: hypothetical protein ABEJ79_06525 [Halolamina sp.]